MGRKKKKNIEIRLVIDTREKKLDYLQDIRFDKVYKYDGIMISGYVIKTCKPLNCTKSVGDISMEYRLENEKRWKKTSLSIERKEDMDIFSTLYSSYKRFSNELNKAKEYNLDFYILHNYTFKDVKDGITKLQNMSRMGYKSNPYYVFLNRYVEVSKEFPVICTSNDFTVVMRRIIKAHIIKNKFQYNY